MIDSTLDEIVKNLDLLRTVVSTTTKLNTEGFGLCPFHEEKTPSFHIFLAKSGRARFHCFGCGAGSDGRGGDVVNFLMLHESLNFRSALARLRDFDINLVNSPVSSFLSPVKVSPPDESLKQDYELLLTENEALRAVAEIGEFSPLNELLSLAPPSTFADADAIYSWVIITERLFDISEMDAYRIASVLAQRWKR